MTDIMDAYIKGRVAAMTHLSRKALDAGAEPPTNPFARGQHLHHIEWTRGFQEMLAQGFRTRPSSPPPAPADSVEDEDAYDLDEELELD